MVFMFKPDGVIVEVDKKDITKYKKQGWGIFKKEKSIKEEFKDHLKERGMIKVFYGRFDKQPLSALVDIIEKGGISGFDDFMEKVYQETFDNLNDRFIEFAKDWDYLHKNNIEFDNLPEYIRKIMEDMYWENLDFNVIDLFNNDEILLLDEKRYSVSSDKRYGREDDYDEFEKIALRYIGKKDLNSFLREFKKPFDLEGIFGIIINVHDLIKLLGKGVDEISFDPPVLIIFIEWGYEGKYVFGTKNKSIILNLSNVEIDFGHEGNSVGSTINSDEWKWY